MRCLLNVVLALALLAGTEAFAPATGRKWCPRYGSFTNYKALVEGLLFPVVFEAGLIPLAVVVATGFLRPRTTVAVEAEKTSAAQK